MVEVVAWLRFVEANIVCELRLAGVLVGGCVCGGQFVELGQALGEAADCLSRVAEQHSPGSVPVSEVAKQFIPCWLAQVLAFGQFALCLGQKGVAARELFKFLDV